jgi:hypothetical protein
MTYNFDPDRWFENEHYIIHIQYQEGQMTRQEYDRAVEELDLKRIRMWDRLDGSYRLPH